MPTPNLSGSSATTLTSSNTGTTLDVSAGFAKSLYWRYSNGTGTITTQGYFVIQTKRSGGTWTNERIITMSPVATATDSGRVPLAPDCVSVQVVYVSPVGATGATLDYEVGTLAITP